MHPLDGPRAKVKRAKAQLIALQKDSERFFRQNPNIIAAAEFDKKAGNYPIIVKRSPSELPEQWSVNHPRPAFCTRPFGLATCFAANTHPL